MESDDSFDVPPHNDHDDVDEEEDEDDEEMEGEDGEYIKQLKNSRGLEELALQNLGLLKLAACPLTDIDRTEKLATRSWKVATKIETSIQKFLENGKQLPPEVLDEFLAPLWVDEPFKSKGFILVGFPNTAADVQYLIDRKYFPEYVHVLDVRPNI